MIEKRYSNISTFSDEDTVVSYSGTIEVTAGVPDLMALTVIHNRSIAEDVHFHVDGAPYSGTIEVVDGSVSTEVSARGRSLIHSVELTTVAFTRGYFGDFGKYIVSIGLMLFAFSTAVAWSYYGDRATTYLFGLKAVLPYRIAYVVGFLHRCDSGYFTDLVIVRGDYRSHDFTKPVRDAYAARRNERDDQGILG